LASGWAEAVGGGRLRPLIAPLDVSRSFRKCRDLIGQWVVAEVGPGRLVPWLAIAFGLGTVCYFTASREPTWWSGSALAALAIAAAVVLHNRPLAFPLALGFFAVAAGFTTATLKSARIVHPVLAFPVSGVSITGFVEIREERERSDRIVVRVHEFDAPRLHEKLERVRVSVKKGTAPPVGAFIEFKARLSAPLAPLRPGGYDFARDLYFQQIGASGFTTGAIKIVQPPTAPSFGLRYLAVIDGMREAIDKRIRAVIGGDKGSIASALITGKRDAISTPVNDAMYISSLAHVLSISGYHMAVVAGMVFFVIRAGFALFPAVAVRRPIKKWAAIGALFAATFYLLLSGAEVATQRSYYMIAIVLVGVLIDRPALTLRTITVAALAVLLLAPEAVVHPSFQMSFAATLALIAAYQHGLPFKLSTDSSLGARVALWGVREIVGLIFASFVAGLATTPYAAFHFHRLAPYGALANLLAMPVVSAWVMPMGILGVLAMPFGLDGPLWGLMGDGLDWMIAVASWVASLPGAVGRIQAFGTGPLLLCTLGLVVLCLLRTPLRWSGAVLALAACVWAVRTPLPDVLVASDGQTVAARGADGRLAVVHSGSDTFSLREWLAADADARAVNDASLRLGARCDDVGCAAQLPDGRYVTFAQTAEAFAEDCERAAVVVSIRQAPAACAATVVDRKVWRQTGAVMLRWTGERFEMSTARAPADDRPWLRAHKDAAAGVSSAPADATPPGENLEPAEAAAQ
jgi:competence protein ComEC